MTTTRARMGRILFGCALFIFASSTPATRAQVTGPAKGAKVRTSSAITAADVAERLAILASDSLEGRRSGAPGGDKAARYIASEFGRLKLEQLSGEPAYYQHFEFSEHALDTSRHDLTKTQNVVAYLRGSDPNLRDQVVVVGAHYDHLGIGGKFALDSVHAIHYGADDNASGVAGMLEIAEHMASLKQRPKRSILFIAFSGEEEGLFGSDHFVQHPLVPLANVQAMLNMDMIGRMTDSTLIVQGIGSSPSWAPLLDESPLAKHFALSRFQTGIGPSDHAKFYAKDMPVLFFFTGFHPDYHRATDTREKINTVGEAKVITFVESLVMNVADRPDKLVFTRVVGDTERKAASFGVYVGGVPDYGFAGDGLKISEIREGSPAEKAGLQKGDVVVQFDEMTIKSIYDYTDALSKHHPGDVVLFHVQRGGAVVTVPVTLGRRPAEH